MNQYNTLQPLFMDLNNSGCGITFVNNSKEDLFITYKELYQNVLHTLGALQNLGVEPGSELVFQIQEPQSFIEIFWACILGKIIPIPINFAVTKELENKLYRILCILKSPFLITSKENYNNNLCYNKQINTLLKEGIIFGDNVNQSYIGKIQEASKDDIAYIQFSSGSTGNPKGVILTHENLLTNIDSIHNGINSPEDGDKFFSWMPLTHDMGLIGFHLTPMAKGWDHYIMPTESFMRNPSLWLNKISEYKITFTSSPNFGYQYILKHFNPEKNKNIDLSSLRVIVNGAEPISKDICLKFNDYFEEYGLSRKAIFPVYGLAEASLAVSFTDIEEEIYSVQVDRNSLNIGDCVKFIKGSESAVYFVSVGKQIKNTCVRIVDHENNTLEKTFVGKIQIKGGNVTSGYYNNKAASSKLITADGWLNTGDLGFEDSEGHLYIVGRDKDILFVHGINFYSHDLERIAEKVPEIELGKVVITADFNSGLSRDEIVAFILYRGKSEDFIFIKRECEKVISEEIGIHLDHVLPVKRIYKTTSGKVQRYRLMKEYRDGVYNKIIVQLDDLESRIESTEINLPETETEEKILKIWKNILGKENIGIHDDFFVLGGNSLKAAQLVMLLQKEMRLAASFEQLYRCRTIKRLSELIKDKPSTEHLNIGRCNSKTYGLSHSQSRIFYHYQLNKASLDYNIVQVFSIAGVLDVDRLKIALRELINRYDILRSTFHMKGGEPYQQVNDDSVISFNKIVLDRNSDLSEQLRKQVLPFSLEELPLIRIKYGEVSFENTILLFDIHHIVADGSSLIKLIEDFFNLYNGKNAEKPELQYGDFVSWEESYLKTEKSVREKEFWLNYLQGDLPQLNLPVDYLKEEEYEGNGSKLFGNMGADVHQALSRLSIDTGISKSVILMSCYSLLLHKLTSQEDIIIGIAESGRNSIKFLDSVGMFVNNLPIRFFPNGNIPIDQFLLNVNNQLIQVLDNKSFPHSVLLDNLDHKNEKGQNPLFNTMFVYQNMDFPELSIKDLKIKHQAFDPKTSKFDITLEVFENKELDFGIEYSNQLFTEKTISKFSKYFKRIVNSVIDNRAIKIKDIEILSNDEKHSLVIGFNNTISECPSFLVHELIEKQIKESSENDALIYKDTKLTYQELEQKATKLSNILIEKGLKPDEFVVLLADRSFEFVISVLGILKAGGAYVPVDPAYPLSRKQYIIEDSYAKFIVATKDIIESNKTILDKFDGSSIIIIDELESYDPALPQDRIQLKPTNLAYMIYTSGTSGMPKGVMIDHRNLMNYIWWAQQVYIKEDKVNFPLFTSVSFDLTVTSIYLPLITGNSIRIYKEDDQSLQILQVLQDDKVGVIKLTPSHLRLIKEDHTIKTENINNLKRFIVGGEELTADLAKEISNKFNNKVEIFNEYGPTEATVGCMIYEYDYHYHEKYNRSVPIGKPSDNSQIFLLDKYFKPVAEGVIGEMFVGGESVARGYHNNNNLTNERFVLIPELSGKKLYKTGDLAKFINCKTIEFVGRSDSQVKFNGYRIELNEIELCMQKFDGISGAVVIKLDNNGTSLLCAYYISEEIISEVKLRQYLQDNLPHYMVPSLLFNIDRIPLTPNGKVDKAALPEINELIDRETYKPAETNIQRLLVEIFQDILNLDQVGINDNFFEMGGDSIKAVQITSRLYDQGIALNVNDILTYQTISQISVCAEKSEREYDQSLLFGEKQLSPIELWFFEQDFEDLNYYNQSVLLEFKDKIDKEILEQVFNKIIEHHDGVRMNYNPSNGYMFFNNEHLSQSIIIEEFKINEERDLVSIGEKLKSSFDITKSLLLKVGIIKEIGKTDRLLITAHHLVIDGISWRILLEDLYNLYQAFRKNEFVKLPLKTGSLIEWRNTLLEYSKSAEMKAQISYWNEINVENIYVSEKKFSDNNCKHAKYHFSLDKETTGFLLKNANKLFKTDIQVILLTALLNTIKSWYNSSCVLIELESYGRNLTGIDVSRTIGWFTSLFPQRFDLNFDDLKSSIIHVKEKLNILPDDGIGYGILKYLCNQITSEDDYPLIRFNYLGQFDVEVSNDLFTLLQEFCGEDISSKNSNKLILEINSLVVAGELKIDLKSSQILVSEDEMEIFSKLYLECIESILAYLKSDDLMEFTPSDFEMVDLDEDDFSNIFD